MNIKNLIIFENNILYSILEELSDQLKFTIINLKKKDLLKVDFNEYSNYLILTSSNIIGVKNMIVINKFPINIFKLIEKLNIEFLKIKFNEHAEIKIRNYIFNLNSREMTLDNKFLKLTEKEINTIVYLYNAKKSVNIQELQSKVWGYQSKLETHTVETHIYRLRKKILETFNEKQFLKSTTSGYQIK